MLQAVQAGARLAGVNGQKAFTQRSPRHDDRSIPDSTESLLSRLRQRPPFRCWPPRPPHCAQEAGSKPASDAPVERKLRIGIVGLGSRGSWIASLFKQHPGYEIVAAVDYFEETANAVGDKLGVPAGKRFSGLSGYKRALDSGVEALVLEDIPYFYPEQAAAAIDAGCHVYMAKPFAVDVPAVFAMQALAKKATEKKLCFRVDYQLPTDPANQEVKQRIAEDALGGLAHIYSGGTCGQLPDPQVGPTIENLFRRAWYSHIALERRFAAAV